MNKHHIRLDGNKVIKGFSDAFEQPQDGDVCINENVERHFELNSVINPPMQDGISCIYKYVDGQVIERTADEKLIDVQSVKKVITEEEKALDLLKIIAFSVMNNDELLKTFGIETNTQSVPTV